MTIQADGVSLSGDLIRNTLHTQDSTESYIVERNTTYQAQWHEILTSPKPMACTFMEGLAVVNLITAIELAAASHTWKEI